MCTTSEQPRQINLSLKKKGKDYFDELLPNSSKDSCGIRFLARGFALNMRRC